MREGSTTPLTAHRREGDIQSPPKRKKKLLLCSYSFIGGDIVLFFCYAALKEMTVVRVVEVVVLLLLSWTIFRAYRIKNQRRKKEIIAPQSERFNNQRLTYQLRDSANDSVQ